jgi:hypothetical protein
MLHHMSPVATEVVGIGLNLIQGVAADRLRVPPPTIAGKPDP